MQMHMAKCITVCKYSLDLTDLLKKRVHIKLQEIQFTYLEDKKDEGFS